FRGRNGANQKLEIEVVGDELPCEQIKQFRMAGWIRFGEVINRFDNSHAEEMSPEPVDCRLGEQRVVAGCDPLGQSLARTRLGSPSGLTTVKVRGLHDPPGTGNVNFATIRKLADHADKIPLLLADNAGEKCRERPELITLPAIKGMVMTLGT